MKRILVVFIFALMALACKNESKNSNSDIEEGLEEIVDSALAEAIEIIEAPIVKTTKEIKQELTDKGFKTFDYVDKKTKDTILMQQYFMVFLKTGPIRGQNEEESAELQAQHLEHLSQMYELGYADISGPFGDDGDMRGVTIYNVPTLKMADSLANADPMVKAGRLEIEIHPWWAAKGFPLR